MAQRDPIAVREKYLIGWNNTMIDIWKERIQLLGVMDTRSLLRSPFQLPIRADGRFYDVNLSQTFLEYGLWQDLGTGREVPIGNPGDIERPKVRERRRWFSVKYFSSVMRLRDFMAQSLGNEFRTMLLNMFDADNARHNTEYYRRKGLS